MDVLSAIFAPTPKPDMRGLDDFFEAFGSYTFNGMPVLPYQTLRGNTETVGVNFAGYVNDGYKASAVVFALELVRMQVFSEARPMYQRMVKGRPGELFATPSLNLLQRPAPGTACRELMARAVLDVDMAGNHFAVRRDGRIKRLRPDWVSIILGNDSDLDPNMDPDAEVVGYLYHPGGIHPTVDPIPFAASDVAHWAPIPDPLANYRGMSWITPVAREIVSDKQATVHKGKFYENGATPNMIIKHQISDPDTLKRWVELFNQKHAGAGNAYKTLHLGAGADATVVGNNFQQLDFKAVQGAAETRIAAASGVGAVMAQFSEGLAGSSLNAGNYAAARRRVADAVFRPLWGSFCESYENIVTVPRNARLWYDERDIAFLREDEKDASEIQNKRAQTIRTLLDAGYTPESVVAAVENDDMTLLEHTGLFSVQLQPPGTLNTQEPSDA